MTASTNRRISLSSVPRTWERVRCPGALKIRIVVAVLGYRPFVQQIMKPPMRPDATAALSPSTPSISRFSWSRSAVLCATQ